MLALARKQSRDQVRGSRKSLLDILHSSIEPISSLVSFVLMKMRRNDEKDRRNVLLV